MNGAGSEGPRVSPRATGDTWIPGTARTDPVISLGTLGPTKLLSRGLPFLPQRVGGPLILCPKDLTPVTY
jgi:hypothetical protein